MFKNENADDSSGLLLWQVSNLWQRKLKEYLISFNLTHSQFVLLASMYYFEEKNMELNQIRLSEHTKIDPMNTSSILENLLKRKLIKKKVSKHDSRAKSIYLTDEGKKLAIETIPIVEEFDSKFFAKVSKKNLNQILIKLREFEK